MLVNFKQGGIRKLRWFIYKGNDKICWNKWIEKWDNIRINIIKTKSEFFLINLS